MWPLCPGGYAVKKIIRELNFVKIKGGPGQVKAAVLSQEEAQKKDANRRDAGA